MPRALGNRYGEDGYNIKLNFVLFGLVIRELLLTYLLIHNKKEPGAHCNPMYVVFTIAVLKNINVRFDVRFCLSALTALFVYHKLIANNTVRCLG
jgi:hypothetical protein